MKIYKKWEFSFRKHFHPIVYCFIFCFPFLLFPYYSRGYFTTMESNNFWIIICIFHAIFICMRYFGFNFRTSYVVWMLLKNCKLSFVKIQYDKPRSKRISAHCDPLCFHNRPQIALCNDLLLHNVPFLDTNNARFIRFYIDFLLQISWMLQNSNLWKKNSILGAQLIIVPEIFRVDGWNQ